MPKANRKVYPSCMRVIINNINANGNLSKIIAENQLVDALYKNCWGTKSNCQRILQQCVREGLLVQLPKKSRNLRLPNLNEIVIGSNDNYCFECHLPGVLISCKQCIRSFHSNCVRRKPEHSKHKMKLSIAFKKQFPSYDSDSSDENAKEVEATLITNTKNINSSTQTLNADETFSNKEEETLLRVCDSSETESKSDVLCMGLVRPPTRLRSISGTNEFSFCKREIVDETSEQTDYELCTCCRLMKIAALRQPPELDSEELCYLLNFSFKSHRFRLKSDVSSYFKAMKMSPAVIDVICHLLFVYSEQDLEWIENKLANNEYKFILEFWIDLLNLQHIIGVFYGSNSEEYLAMSYFERFIYYDLSEISRCPDCFRHSNEQHTHFWFAKPCLQRHEIVFAKVPGSPYWPGKVLRVLRHNRYDVRFFGGKHERALVPISNIRSNDHNLSDNEQVQRGIKLKQAINEMRLYNSLSLYSPCNFSYRADKFKMEEIIFSLIGWPNNIGDHNGNISINVPTNEEIYCIKGPNSRSSKTNLVIRRTLSSLAKRDSSSGGQSLAAIGTRSQCKKAKQTNEPPTTQQSSNFTEIRKYIIQNHALKKENEELKKKLKKCEDEQNEIKRKQWCPSCLKEVVHKRYYRYAYCSLICRENNFKKKKNKA